MHVQCEHYLRVAVNTHSSPETSEGPRSWLCPLGWPEWLHPVGRARSLQEKGSILLSCSPHDLSRAGLGLGLRPPFLTTESGYQGFVEKRKGLGFARGELSLTA